MKQPIHQADVLVVYSSRYATSPRKESITPFAPDGDLVHCNICYGYFLKRCEKLGLQAAFVTSDDIIGPGLFQGYWSFDGTWQRHPGKIRSSVLFDKFTPLSKDEQKALSLLLANKKIYTFSSDALKSLMKDKLNTYHAFPDDVIPTVAIPSLTVLGMHKAKKQLQNVLKTHPKKQDCGNQFVIKDRFGTSGNNIFKYTEKTNMKTLLQMLRETGGSYILQPFILYDKGFTHQNISGRIEIRLIISNKKPFASYLRVAKKGDFKSNVHQGGTQINIRLSDAPKRVKTIAKKIIEKIPGKHAVFSLDFIIGNHNNVFLVEANNNPGIDWSPRDRAKGQLERKVIHRIIRELQAIIAERT